MSESVVLPALGESVTEGTVTRWLKKVGDSVNVDEPLVEVSTDKVDTEIPSPVAGVIEQILVQEDETVQVGAVLVIIGSGSGSAAPAAPAAAAPVAPPVVQAPPAPVAPPVVAAPVAPPVVAAPVAPPVIVAPPVVVAAPVVAPPVAPPVVAAPVISVPAASSTDAGYVTPLVRKFAQDSGVDLSRVSGTGVGGRIRKEDVMAATSAPVGSSAAPAAAHVPAPISALRGTSEPMSRLRKVLAERAVASMVSSAQLTTVVEVDVVRLPQWFHQLS